MGFPRQAKQTFATKIAIIKQRISSYIQICLQESKPPIKLGNFITSHDSVSALIRIALAHVFVAVRPSVHASYSIILIFICPTSSYNKRKVTSSTLTTQRWTTSTVSIIFLTIHILLLSPYHTNLNPPKGLLLLHLNKPLCGKREHMQ
jgi:hypothetical protein